jgi:hypothetical protein
MATPPKVGTTVLFSFRALGSSNRLFSIDNLTIGGVVIWVNRKAVVKLSSNMMIMALKCKCKNKL